MTIVRARLPLNTPENTNSIHEQVIFDHNKNHIGFNHILKNDCNYSNICMKVWDKLQSDIKPVKGKGMVVMAMTWWR